MENWYRGETVPRTRWYSESRTVAVGEIVFRATVQHLFPLELACDMTTVEPIATLNAEAPTFTSKRSAAQEARGRIAAIAEEERRD